MTKIIHRRDNNHVETLDGKLICVSIYQSKTKIYV